MRIKEDEEDGVYPGPNAAMQVTLEKLMKIEEEE